MPPLLPFDYDAARVSIVQFVRAATGLDEDHVTTMEPEVAYDPRPTLPYAAFKLTTSATRYGDDVPMPQAQGIAYGGPRGIAVSFNSFGRSHEEAYSLMAAVQMAASMPSLCDILGAAGVAVWRTGAINDLSMLLNTGYEGRAQMDLFGGIAFNTQPVPQDSIAGANVVGNVVTDASTQQVTITTEGR